jgi:poly-beta-1,6-N-acetyl-D-glucosamine synthase
MTWVFWLSVAVVAYVYAGYPLLLRVWAAIRHRSDSPVRPISLTDRPDWGVSVVIAARNEGARLAARIDNLLALDYPADKRQIIVVSDGSTDDTMEVLARYPHDVIAVSVPPGGKALAINAGLARATNEIVVFADARQVFAPDTLRELVAPFADLAIGGVTGELLLDAESPCRRAGQDRRAAERRRKARERALDRRLEERRRTLRSTIADGIGLYWKYEKALRRLESAIDSTIGATGAIYAIRRELFQPLPADTILDDVLTPMRVVLSGYRVVFNERAKAFDRAAVDADAEMERKIRTLAGNYQILSLEPRLLRPWANRVWLQYVSHKLGRLAVPYALLALYAASTMLAETSVLSMAVLGGQVALYLLAGCGALLEWRARRKDAALVVQSIGIERPPVGFGEMA